MTGPPPKPSGCNHHGPAGLMASRGASRRFGVKRIEIRTIIAYLLIAAVIFGAVAGIAYLRHNSARARHLRERSRPVRQWVSHDSDADAAPGDDARHP